MNRYFLALVVAALTALTTGCMTRYHVGVTSYLSDEVPFPPATKDTKIAVVAESDPDEPLLEKEVKRKIEYLVGQSGFSVGTLDNADYILSAFFAIDGGSTETGTAPVHHSGGVSTTHIYTSSGQWATGTTYHPGYTTYVPYSYTYFTRYLGVNLYERERWLTSQSEDLSDAIAWRGTTISSGSSSDLRSVIDYLLVATFEEFGEDTGKRKRSTLLKNDKRVKELRASQKRNSNP